MCHLPNILCIWQTEAAPPEPRQWGNLKIVHQLSPLARISLGHKPAPQNMLIHGWLSPPEGRAPSGQGQPRRMKDYANQEQFRGWPLLVWASPRREEGGRQVSLNCSSLKGSGALRVSNSFRPDRVSPPFLQMPSLTSDPPQGNASQPLPAQVNSPAQEGSWRKENSN